MISMTRVRIPCTPCRGATLNRGALRKQTETYAPSSNCDRLTRQMSLSVSDKLGPYEILAPIGKGGMGEVYRARDTRLNREVAVKVSAERFTERFEHEARAIAALNHFNICHLYDVGSNYLVMELVDGPTLAERLKQGAMPLEEALAAAGQIADALDAAHEKGITHRDLKPGNIKIKPDGTVKVLDFGLAKMGGTPTVQSDNSPTVTMTQTAAGVILGTASYMSPEQARGKPVDHRADIYAFGLVLYEMLTGERLHGGDTTTEVLASVIREEPHWDKVPARVQRLLRRCLEKDPQKRLRHIGDVMALVDDVPAAPVAAPGTVQPRWRSRIVLVSASVLVAASAAGCRLASQACASQGRDSLCDVPAAWPSPVHEQAGARDIAGRYAAGLFCRSRRRFYSALSPGYGRSGIASDSGN